MSEVVLPKEWVKTKIADVTFKGLQRKPSPEESFIYIDIGSIDRQLKKISTPQSLTGADAPSRARKEVNTGDILVSLTRPNLNAVALITSEYDKQIASTGFEVIKPVGIESRFLFGLVRSKDFIDAISGKVQGALYPAAKSADVQNFEFGLPPLTEQKEIAARLDNLLTQVDSIKKRLDAISAILKRFRQSVLAAAVSGRLTGAVPLQEKPVSELVREPLKNGKSVKDGDGPRVLRLTALKGRYVDLNEFKTGHWDESTASKYYVVEGDILVSRGNGSLKLVGVGRTVPCVDVATAYPDTMIRIRVDNSIISPSYFLIAWSSLSVRSQIEQVAKTTAGIWKVSQKDLGKIRIPTFDIREQAEIARRVEKFFAFSEQVERKVYSAQSHVNNLTQSILAKAFRGELTSDWREQNAELISGTRSAKALLKRIKEEAEVLNAKKKTRKKA